jgi:protein-tyrosine phosphatase
MSLPVRIPDERPLQVLFVCTGNICRSPTAEGVARRLFAEAGLEGRVTFDSAGTHGYHVGEPPDPRTRAFAAQYGYDLSGLRARRVVPEDFVRFDLLLAMDRGHFEYLHQMRPRDALGHVALFSDLFSTSGQEDVPDPYYGGDEGFRSVLEMSERGARAMIEVLGPALRGAR